jgi:hypothetical protein
MCGGETHQINLRRRIETAALMGRRFFISLRVPDALNKKHYELNENCAANQRRKPKSSSLQQQRHVVVPLHRTSSGFHEKPCPDVVANAKSPNSSSEARPLAFENSGRNRMKVFEP